MARAPDASDGPTLDRREALRVGAAALAALALVRPRGAAAEASAWLVGPLVGHATDTSVALWTWVPLGDRVELAYRPEGAPWSAVRRVPLTQDPAERGVARALVTGLVPATRYVYRVLWDGTSHPDFVGRFRTAPPPGARGRVRLGVSSCMKPDQPGVSFERLRAEDPDFHLLIGDNAYADSTDPRVIWRRHVEMRRVTELQRLARETSTYAIWDDHDFAGDNTDGTARGKERSLAAFRRLFANPSYGLPDVPGVFFRFAWGALDLFLLDVRYHRSPDRQPDGPEKRVLGEAQMRWLADGLAASTAVFKLVASGSVLDAPEADTWRDFPTDRARLFRILAERRVGGVVFLTGDLHRCLVQEHGPERTGVPHVVPEVVSSGIMVGGDHGFAVLDADTLAPDPTLRVRILLGDGRVPEDRTYRRSQLGP